MRCSEKSVEFALQVRDLPPANMLSGLNLTVYTATIGGTINTVETLGVFTSKVAELQVVSVDGSNFGMGSLGAGLGLLLTLLLLLLLLVVRVRVRSSSSAEESGPVEVRGAVVRGADEVAYTVYDKVDLLSPATEVGEESYDEYLATGPSSQRLPPPPPSCRGLRGRSGADGHGHGHGHGHGDQHGHGHGDGHGAAPVGGNSSVDSLSSLLSHLHHQESV